MSKKLDALGDRLKAYEKMETEAKFLPTLPVYARIDGRCFSKFTRGMERPYDSVMSSMMQETTRYLVEQTGALTGYTQSDEISLVWYSDDPKSEIFLFLPKNVIFSNHQTVIVSQVKELIDYPLCADDYSLMIREYYILGKKPEDFVNREK